VLRWKSIVHGKRLEGISEESLGYYESKTHKPWFDEGCSQLLNQKKQAKIAVVTGTKRNKLDNLNNARGEASRHFRNKKKEYLKYKINERAMNSKNKKNRDLYREINEFKRGYQLRNQLSVI
jgi:hypothetical protein